VVAVTVVIAVLNRKGGVGKTTLTKDLSHALVAGGRRVLMVGLDPQASLEVVAGLGFDTPPEQTVSRLLLPEEFPLASRWTPWCTRRPGRRRSASPGAAVRTSG
jgi:cellulose biosynthesis protein BcsQ